VGMSAISSRYGRMNLQMCRNEVLMIVEFDVAWGKRGRHRVHAYFIFIYWSP
jgi:hypothetical protein